MDHDSVFNYRKTLKYARAWYQGIRYGMLCLVSAGCIIVEASESHEAGALVVPKAVLSIPRHLELEPGKVALGERLFNDKRLSNDGTYACVSCHYFDKGGTDQERLSPSIDGGKRAKNTPTIFNVGLLPMYTWSGKRVTLPDLAEAIIKSKKGLGSDWPAILTMLGKDSKYRQAFAESYPDGIAVDNVKDALAEFMRSLTTPDSRFDRYLRGDTGALTSREQQGYKLFDAYGCVACHQGINLGGNMVSPFGMFGNYMEDRGNVGKADLGRFNVTGLEEDKYVFRVPGLRNVDLTAPYFHDGSVESLEQAVDIMGDYMLGRTLPKEDVQLITDFLRTLTGEYKGKPL